MSRDIGRSFVITVCASLFYVQAQVPEWIDPLSSVTAVLGANVTFTWQHKYSFPSHAIFIRKRRETSAYVTEFIEYVYGEALHTYGIDNDSVGFNKTSTGDGEIIRVTLLNTTEDDYGLMYECDIIFGDGQELVSEIKLEKLIDLSTIQDYSLTTNSEPATESVSRTNVIVLYAVITVMLVIVILQIFVSYYRKDKCGGYIPVRKTRSMSGLMLA